MHRRRHAIRWSFQTRVLVPVVVIMVILVVVPLGIITHRMTAQLAASAAENLRANDAVFQNLQALRLRNLVVRYASVPNEPRFRAVLLKAVIESSEPGTLRTLLDDVREELGADAVLFFNEDRHKLAGVARAREFDLENFSAGANASFLEALTNSNESVADTLTVNGRAFDVVALPVTVAARSIGTLVFASEISVANAREFTELTRSEIVFFAGDRIAGTTLKRPELVADLPSGVGSASGPNDGHILIGGEHFMFIPGHLGRGAPGVRVGYLLLTSYERPLRALLATKETFLCIQLLGIVAGIAIVWGLVRRATSPLRELRDSAEAVGEGDFSRRVEVKSHDECGELATVFNRMTANLKSSREALEKTVETLKTTQAQLLQSEKLRAIGTLAGGIAHDFNNILGSILGFTELVAEDLPSDGRAAKNLQQVLKAGKRAKDLVRQILSFSRETEPQRTRIRLSALIDETTKLLRVAIPRSVQLQSCVRTDADEVIGDPTQLHQVLMNLGTNAAHAMREKGGTFSLTLEDVVIGASNSDALHLPFGSYLRLTASDTGHGMDAATLGRIFEPFFTTKPVGEGTGLGLSVVHGIVKNHGGEITARSLPGLGASFQIYLPHADPAAGALETDSATAEKLPGGRECILVVDDDEPLVNMMQQKLNRLGYEVVACTDSRQALEHFQREPDRFSAIISDQNMPRFSGVELAAEISRARPAMPVVLCSGSQAVAGPHGPMPSTVCECVAKPVDFAQLSHILRQAIEHKSAAPNKQP